LKSLLAVQAVADDEELMCSKSTAYRLVRDAREHGFLDGNELTDRAREEFDKPDSRPQ
jgi:hypothetical protein